MHWGVAVTTFGLALHDHDAVGYEAAVLSDRFEVVLELRRVERRNSGGVERGRARCIRGSP